MTCESSSQAIRVFELYRAAMFLHWLSGWLAAAAAFRQSVVLP